MRTGLVVLLALATFAAARPFHAAAQQPPPVFHGIGYAELAAEELGFEYRNVLRDAWDVDYDGSAQALSDLFGMAVEFEAEAAEAHGRVLRALMLERGDEAFAARLAQEPATVRTAVVRAIRGAQPRLSDSAFPKTIAAGLE